MSEHWRVVPSVETLAASSLGRVRVLPYEAAMPHGGTRFYNGHPTCGAWDGKRYLFRHRGRTYRVARLVCEAFNGEALTTAPYCLHRDEDASNNRPGNLVWGTQRENLNAPGFLTYAKRVARHKFGARRRQP